MSSDYKSTVLLCHPDDDGCPVCEFLGGSKTEAHMLEVIRVLDRTLADEERFSWQMTSLAIHTRELIQSSKATLEHLQELREAWMSGAITERDGKGGTRSNRNVEVEERLRTALENIEKEVRPQSAAVEIGEAFRDAQRQMPDGYEVQVSIRRGETFVSLFSPSGDEVAGLVPAADLADTIRCAVADADIHADCVNER